MSNTQKRRTYISYGGGVQSTALVVLAALRDPDFESVMGGRVTSALFANVGDDSEHPRTLPFVRDVVTPWAAERDVWVRELTTPDGVTLYQRITQPGHRGITIPLRAANGAPQQRHCTTDHKVKVVDRWLKQYGATKDAPATVAIGISTDEMERANNRKDKPHRVSVYPLLEMGWNRSRCQQFVVDHLGVEAPESSCWFCPFHRPQRWAEMRRDEPRLFESAVALEGMVLARQRVLGHGPLYLSRFGRPLDEAIGASQDALPGFGTYEVAEVTNVCLTHGPDCDGFNEDGYYDEDDTCVMERRLTGKTYTVDSSIGEAGCDEGACFT